MASTKKKRKRSRKHRGTQGGGIDRRGRTSRPRNRSEAKSRATKQSRNRFDSPPTWRGAVLRATIAAAVFAVIVFAVFGQSVTQGAPLVFFMFGLYVPLGYYTDRFFYSRRMRQKQKQAEERHAARGKE